MGDRATEIGKTVPVGITRDGANGAEEYEQFAGSIIHFTQDEPGMAVIACSDGIERTYPWDERALSPAPPGEYRLRSTGEIIKNPDWLMQWTVRKEH